MMIMGCDFQTRYQQIAMDGCSGFELDLACALPSLVSRVGAFRRPKR
jgi:hypothetical protein